MKEDRKKATSCIFSLARLILVMPLWGYLVYTILTLVAAPTYIFVIFWVYIGAVFGLAILEALVQMAND